MVGPLGRPKRAINRALLHLSPSLFPLPPLAQHTPAYAVTLLPLATAMALSDLDLDFEAYLAELALAQDPLLPMLTSSPEEEEGPFTTPAASPLEADVPAMATSSPSEGGMLTTPGASSPDLPMTTSSPDLPMTTSSPEEGTSSGSGTVAVAGLDNDDGVDRERRLRRKVSNRESARRSRARKQRHLEEQRAAVAALRAGNRHLAERLRAARARAGLVALANARLRAQGQALGRRLAAARQTLALRHLLAAASASGGSLDMDALASLIR